MKFAVGDLAIDKSIVRARTSYNVMKVVGVLNGALLLEQYGCGFDGKIDDEDVMKEYGPGSRVWREGVSRREEKELFTPTEVVAELRRLEEAESKLDSEFETVREQAKSKLDQAAKLVNEAAAMVSKCGKDCEDLLRESEKLYKALDKGGWCHSTMMCKFGHH